MSITNNTKTTKLTAVDLFSGCGGLTLGLKRAGFDVVAGVENDQLACSSYKKNHPRTKLFEKDIREIVSKEFLHEIGKKKGEIDLVAGCPPCQGFSSMRTKNGGYEVEEPMNDLVFEFLRLVLELKPRAVMMENVPGLATDERAAKVVQKLRKAGYRCRLEVFNAADFGAAQRRRRMILLGTLGQEPFFAEPSIRRRTVRGVIGKLPTPSNSDDPLHNYGVKRADAVMKIIRLVPKDGGSRTDLSEEYRLQCHKDCNGFKDVYGRMAWSALAPTITGGCINPSKGRFLHPEQNRAITLREAAMLQGFPRSYKFDLSRGRYPAAQMIGNAFPPIFAQKHADALRKIL